MYNMRPLSYLGLMTFYRYLRAMQAVTRVLAPHLSDHVDRHPPEIERDEGDANNIVPASSSPVDGNTIDDSNKTGLSAAAVVHDAQGVAGQQESRQASSTSSLSTKKKDDEVTRKRSAGTAEGPPLEEPSSCLRDRDGQEWWGAAKTSLVDFVAKYMELSLVQVGPRLTNAVLVSVAEGGGGVAAGAGSSQGAVAGVVGLGGAGGGGGGGGREGKGMGTGSSHDAQAR